MLLKPAEFLSPLAFALLAYAGQAGAQTASPETSAETVAEPVALLTDGKIIDFEADALSYDETNGIIRATGKVYAKRDGYELRADEVIYNRNSGQVEARGNVVLTSPDGQTVNTDRLEVSDSLKDGIVDNIRLVLDDGSRLAALSGTKSADKTTLNRAVYSPCEVCNSKGKEQPLWQIKALRVVRDEKAKRVYYKDAYIELLNQPVLYLPYLSHPDPSVNRATGILVPQIKTRPSLGIAVEIPYFINLAPWRDITLTPSIYSASLPGLGVEYRERLNQGPLRLGGFITYASGSTSTNATTAKNEIRGYVYGDARLQHGDDWRSTVKIKLTTDDTFLRRYDISNEDSLRNSYSLERQTTNSYFRTEIQYFQGLRRATTNGLTPLVLPAIDYWWRSQPSWLGGRFTAEGNTVAIFRTKGLDSQRASLTAGYEIPFLNKLGQQFKFTLQARSDFYRVTDNDRPDDPVYAGRNGTFARITPVAAAEIRWPLIAPGFGGTQILEPILQLVAARRDTNVANFPNEDSRSIDLDETNLFSLNRFPGYDRFEGGTRITYGARYTVDAGKVRLETQFGQSYRLNADLNVFPSGTGLAGKFSDFVGRTSLRIGNRIDLVHRFRIDKNKIAIRRNEIDAIFSGNTWSASLGYSRLNRNIGIEDLEDREEVRVAGRAKIAKYWALVGSSIVDLTARAPTNALTLNSSNFNFIRNSVGIEYEDECLLFGLSWRRNYTQDRDFQRGSTVIFRLVLKSLGGVN
jgi:LPS-assembly protein